MEKEGEEKTSGDTLRSSRITNPCFLGKKRLEKSAKKEKKLPGRDFRTAFRGSDAFDDCMRSREEEEGEEEPQSASQSIWCSRRAAGSECVFVREG